MIEVTAAIITWWLLLMAVVLPTLWVRNRLAERRDPDYEGSPWKLFEGTWAKLPLWKKPIQAAWYGLTVVLTGIGTVLFGVAALLWALVAVYYVLTVWLGVEF